MNFLDFFNISERNIELINPISPEKILRIGEVLRLSPGQRVLDFGCGYAEPLKLWAEKYGISGVGIDIREHVCIRAMNKLEKSGLSDRIEIICKPGAEYEYEDQSFDVSTCIGASFVWDGFRSAVQAMRNAIKPGGRLAIGEAYWKKSEIPPKLARKEMEFMPEFEILNTSREEGFDIEFVVRASQDDWDNYEASNWLGLHQWIDENPDHPERQEVINHLHKCQDEYFSYGRELFGWGIYVLKPR